MREVKIREWIGALRGKLSRLAPWQSVLLAVLVILVVASLGWLYARPMNRASWG